MTVRRRPPWRSMVGARFAECALVSAVLGWAGPALGLELPAADCVVTPYATVDVSSAAPGVLESVEVDRSDQVEAGQVIARLASGVERTELEIARARAGMDTEVHLWEATLEFDRQNRERVTSLHNRQVVSAQDREKAERDAEVSGWKLRRARDVHELRQLELNRALEVLEQKTIRSPIGGVVARRFKSPGEYVEDHPVVRIVRLDPLRVEAILPMEQFGRIADGMAADVFLETGEGNSNRAIVEAVDRLGEAASGTFGVRLVLPNPGHRLPAGVKCSVQFLPLEQMAGSTAEDEVSVVAPSTSGDRADGSPLDVEPMAAASENSASGHGWLGATVPMPSPALEGDTQIGIQSEPLPSATVDSRLGDGWGQDTEPLPTVALGDDSEIGIQFEPLPSDTGDSSSGDEWAQDTDPLPIVALAGDAELGIQPDPVIGDAVDPASSQQLAQVSSSACRTVGPLADDKQVERVHLVLTVHGYDAVPQKVVARRLIGYMVMTSEQPTTDDLRALEGRLRRGGVHDFLAYPRGAFAGRISLGVYSERERAEARVRQLEALGFQTEVLEHTKATTQWWLSLQPPPAEVEADMLRFALEQARLDFGDGPINCQASPDLLASN